MDPITGNLTHKEVLRVLEFGAECSGLTLFDIWPNIYNPDGTWRTESQVQGWLNSERLRGGLKLPPGVRSKPKPKKSANVALPKPKKSENVFLPKRVSRNLSKWENSEIMKRNLWSLHQNPDNADR